jgi:cyclophilin family peptidyl-prolyl cis-trans isomerase
MAEKTYDRPPEMALKPDYEYYVNFVTEKGPVKVRLFAEEAPETVNNFVFLARDGYFDGTTFHRVIGEKEFRRKENDADRRWERRRSAISGIVVNERSLEGKVSQNGTKDRSTRGRCRWIRATRDESP